MPLSAPSPLSLVPVSGRSSQKPLPPTTRSSSCNFHIVVHLLHLVLSRCKLQAFSEQVFLYNPTKFLRSYRRNELAHIHLMKLLAWCMFSRKRSSNRKKIGQFPPLMETIEVQTAEAAGLALGRLTESGRDVNSATTSSSSSAATAAAAAAIQLLLLLLPPRFFFFCD